jgi:caffeoyl-CoA O-methyltransferase
MDKVFGQDDPSIAQYAEDVFKPVDPVLQEIIDRTVKNGLPEIYVAPMDGLHLEVIARAVGAKKAVEIGTLGGYSGVCLCRGMGPEGKLYTFEMNPLNAEVARTSFEKAGFKDNVEIHVGPALLNLPLVSKYGPFDLVFIDADKPSYPDYLRWAAANLRVGGIVLGDNTFAWGEISNSDYDKNTSEKPSVTALRAFNKECASSGRFKATVLPTGEGLTFAVKIK